MHESARRVCASVPGLQAYKLWNQVWNIDCHLRYTVARRALAGIQPQRLVEVGAGVAGLGFLLKQPVMAVDIWFNAEVLRRFNPYVIPVIGTALNLPLGNNSMDAALSIDSIEHVPPQQRADAIDELLRVAKKRVVISIPCGNAAEDADARLIRWFHARHGARSFWLSEHRELGLPDDDAMYTMIDQAARRHGKRVSIASLWCMPILMHDINHRVLMMANYRFARLLSLALWLAYPLLLLAAGRARYRRFYFVEIHGFGAHPPAGDP